MALNFKEVDKHTPKDNEVLIRVKMIIPNTDIFFKKLFDLHFNGISQ